MDNTIINDLAVDSSGLWLATNKGLWHWGVDEKLIENAVLLEKGDFKALALFAERVYAATFDQGILVWDKKEQKGTLVSGPSRINSLAILDQDRLWVATDNAGIAIFRAADLTPLQEIGREEGLSVFNIRKCIQDRQSNIWIATSGGGLYKYAPNNFRHYDRESGLKGNRVYALYRGTDGIWASNSEAGLVQIDSLGIHEPFEDARLLNVKIKTITGDTSGNVWVGTEGRGIFWLSRLQRDSVAVDSTVFPVRTDTFKVTTPVVRQLEVQVGLAAAWVRKILLDGPNIWIATYSNGIMRFQYDPAADNVRQLKRFDRSDGMENVLMNDIALDSKGRLWYATKNGHLGFIRRDSVYHLGNVLDQYVDIGTILLADQRIFLGTAGDGIWWARQEDRPANFTKLAGNKTLFSDNIYQLIFDQEKQLWAGSESGVDKIVLDDSTRIVEVFHFGRNDGFLGIETCLNAVAKDPQGNLWFGTIYGLTRYQPQENTLETARPKLAFEDVSVFYKSLDTIDVNRWDQHGKVLVLSPRENHLFFKYRTVDINHPLDISYRWRLNEGDWSPWTTDNSVNFAGLSYGAYRFEAQSRNRFWEESDPIGFNFYITQPLYEKSWFRRSMLAGLLLILSGITWGYIRRLKRRGRQEKEKLKMENHLLSLEQKALRLQMNPHFVFNVLNGIKAMGPQDPEKMNTTINKFATLLRSILHNSRQDHISLAQEIQTLENYLEVEQLMSPKHFDYHIELEATLDPEEILIPPMLIQPFVENAIRHGLMPVQRAGKLLIHFHTTEYFLYCVIEDNGIGIYQAQQQKTATSHQSIALEVTRERIASLAGEDTLLIREVAGEADTPGGTRVEFKIPLLTEY